MPLLLDAARAFIAADCCPIPAKADGSKAPALISWAPYMIDLPSDDQLVRWFGGDTYDGLGVVCGTVSRGLEMLELEGRAIGLAAPLAQLLADNGAAELWTRLCAGYLERSPSGGLHFLYRVGDAPARHNTKLARRPATADELAANPTDRVKVLIETRGEGGFVVTAPSAGRTHPTGLPWTMLAGGTATIPTISADERDLLYWACNQYDLMPAAEPGNKQRARPANLSSDFQRAGDDYNERASWDDILGPAGWKRTRKNFVGNGAAWTRPGKERGVSATTGTASDGIDRFYVFSTSTTFETEIPYSKFAVYTHLEHDGNYDQAATALRRPLGEFGTALEEVRDSLTFSGAPPLGVSDRPGGGSVQSPAAPQYPPSGPTGSGPPPPASQPLPIQQPGSYSLTDDGNALRLVDSHGAVLRYCPQRGQWLRWGGHRWIWDEAESVRELARDVARQLPTNAKPQQVFRAKSLQNGAINAMCRLAQSDERIVINLTELDARPYELNTPGGIIDLRTGKLHPPDPARMHSRSTACAPDPEMPAPRWERFLAETFAGEPELSTYIQRLLGLSLIGEVLEQKLPFPYGAGANGKTTLLNTTQKIIGLGDGGYSISAPAEILLNTRNTDHPATIAQLSGARLVVTSELEEGQQFAEGRVKQLTGSDPINARFMARNPFTFIPTHTLWLHANHRPAVKAGGPAFWRRIALIPFIHTVPLEQRDTTLEGYLIREEGPAILAWLVRGCAAYLAGGLIVPTSVTEAVDAYQLDQDTVTRFVRDMCSVAAHTHPDYRIKVSDLRNEYEQWCHYEGESPVNRKAFTQDLRTAFGVYSERTSDARWYAGIRMKVADGGLGSSPSNDDRPWWKDEE
jgi:putative DNA primase/helicase